MASRKKGSRIARGASRTKIGAVAAFLIVAFTIPFALSLEHTTTNTQSHASASTTLSFTQSKLHIKVGDAISLGVMVNPGNNIITFIKLVIDYDKTAVQPLSNGISIGNIPGTTTPFTVFEAPQTTCSGNTCSIIATLSIGADPTHAIKIPGTIATINFQAIGAANNSQITFDKTTQVLSIAPSDSPSENVLSTSIPAMLKISGR